MGPITERLPVSIIWRLPLEGLQGANLSVDVNPTDSSRSHVRGIALVDSDFFQRGLSETIRSQRWACFRMRSTRRPRTPVPLAVLTRLVVTGGDGRSSGRELAVEHGSRARVRSETGQTIAGSFVVNTRRTGWVVECTLSLTEAFPSASLIARRRTGQERLLRVLVVVMHALTPWIGRVIVRHQPCVQEVRASHLLQHGFVAPATRSEKESGRSTGYRMQCLTWRQADHPALRLKRTDIEPVRTEG